MTKDMLLICRIRMAPDPYADNDSNFAWDLFYFISLKFAKSANHPSMICRIKMAPDPYADIDFDEINEATSLAHDEIKCLKVNYVKQTYLLCDITCIATNFLLMQI